MSKDKYTYYVCVDYSIVHDIVGQTDNQFLFNGTKEECEEFVSNRPKLFTPIDKDEYIVIDDYSIHNKTMVKGRETLFKGTKGECKEFAAMNTQKETFTKHDSDKSRVDLVEPSFILGIGNVLGFGAKKYGDNNWKQMTKEDIPRIRASLLRHYFAYAEGEELDTESGLPHLHHLACNVMFLWYVSSKSKSND